MVSVAVLPRYCTYRYVLPFPPSVNHYWRRQGHRYFVSKQGVAFREAVALACKRKPHTRRRLAITLQYQRDDNTTYDIDNYAKAVLDALAHAGVFQNDKQVDLLIQKRLPVARVGACFVEVEEVGPEQVELKC